jgi:hypothetical protein
VTVGLIIPTLEVLEGGVQVTEMPPYIMELMMVVLTAVVMTTAVRMTEAVIEG